MKKLELMTIIMVLLIGCNEDAAVRNIKGGYHYKTSGQVTVTEADKTTRSLILPNETGILEVVSLHDDDEIMITFNQTNGGVYHTNGVIKKDLIRFDSFSRTITLPTESTRFDTITVEKGLLKHDTIVEIAVTENEDFVMTVKGSGQAFDNNLLFLFEYEGKSTSSDRKIEGRDIEMIAKRN